MELDAALQNRRLDSEKPGKCEILPHRDRLVRPALPRNPPKAKLERFHSLN